MFCERMHCALILMVTLAQRYGVGDVELHAVAHQHNLPITSFQGVVKRLLESNLIIIKSEETLALKIAPGKITIWQVVVCVLREEALECGKRSSQKERTSTVIMIRKEDEALHNIISSRLKRCKLSEWSKRASETVYI